MGKAAVVSLGLLLVFSGGALLSRSAGAADGEAAPPGKVGRVAAVPGVEAVVRAAVERHAADARAKAAEQLRVGERVTANFKTPAVQAAIVDPWAGAAELERHGLALSLAGRDGPQRIGQMLDSLCAAIGKPVGERGAVNQTPGKSLHQYVRFATAVFDRARSLRDEAIVQIPADKQTFMINWQGTMSQAFGPQLPLNEQTQPLLQNDRAFCAFMELHCDWGKFVGAAHTLAVLAEPEHVDRLRRVLASARPVREKVAGVGGDILYHAETPHGLILFGGPGDNTYELNRPVALLVDAGGNDRYQGVIATSYDAAHPHSVVIDLAGDDEYRGAAHGLATGRLGVGMLVDVAGDDTYHLERGSGGTGFGGVGVLYDLDGNDTYVGSRFTQGAAIAGIGLLYDGAGDDAYTSFGFGLGFGGPLGAGAVLDMAGDDSYQCGGKYPSGYNNASKPPPKPQDPTFQYTAMGMGMGLGRRILSREAKDHAYALAGGIGMVVDVAGDDSYTSSNFSQGCGYYFGSGLKLDLAGNDVHGGARYGHASGAHFGQGLFVDYAGADTYGSTGPTYNGGCAWDHSAFVFIDAGIEGDKYEWSRSAGFGRADIGSWGMFADVGGDDTYAAAGLPGACTRVGLAVFFDAAGTDDYTGIRGGDAAKAVNGRTHADPAGGLFIDR